MSDLVSLFAFELVGWQGGIWLAAGLTCVVAGVVRGFTGFGFPLILITAMSLVVDPIAVVPVALLLDIASGVRLLPTVRGEIDRTGTTMLTLGALPAIPVGVWLLSSLDAENMRLAIGVIVLIAVLLIAKGVRMRRAPGKGLMAGTGVIAGLMTGSMGMPGPPVILVYLSSPLPVSTLRATSVAFFLVTDIVALSFMLAGGLVDIDALIRALILLPVVEVAVQIGRRLYGVAEQSQVKRATLILLAVLAVAAITKSVV